MVLHYRGLIMIYEELVQMTEMGDATNERWEKERSGNLGFAVWRTKAGKGSSFLSNDDYDGRNQS